MSFQCHHVTWNRITKEFVSCDINFPTYAGLTLPTLKQFTWETFSLRSSAWFSLTTRQDPSLVKLTDDNLMRLRSATQLVLRQDISSRKSYELPVGGFKIRTVEILVTTAVKAGRSEESHHIVWLWFDMGSAVTTISPWNARRPWNRSLTGVSLHNEAATTKIGRATSDDDARKTVVFNFHKKMNNTYISSVFT